MARKDVVEEVGEDEEAMNVDGVTPDTETEDSDDDADAKKLIDVSVDALRAEFADIDDDNHVRADNQGRIVVGFDGTFEFVIHESIDEDGKIQYTSSLFKTKKDELYSAIKLGCENAIRLVLKRRWEELYPPEPKVRMTRASAGEMLAELDLMKRQFAVIREAHLANTEPDWDAAGIPAPDDWEL